MARKAHTPLEGYREMLIRLTTNMERKRVSEDGIDALHLMGEITKLQEETITKMVAFLRSIEGGSHSWGEVGEALGITKQAAQQRYGGEGARKPGGQPANLR